MKTGMLYRLLAFPAILLLSGFIRWIRAVDQPNKVWLGVVEGVALALVVMGTLLLLLSFMG